MGAMQESPRLRVEASLIEPKRTLSLDASISRHVTKDNGLVPIIEPEILLDGDHPIERTLEVAEKVWTEVFFYLAENNVIFEEFSSNLAWLHLGLSTRKRLLQKPLPIYSNHA
ncbi:fructose-bisphosphate aldolase 3 [Spatholobus suberectus]|nr:fructose-bisphosphate aldolase 3 [Spatholobus suberectus]